MQASTAIIIVAVHVALLGGSMSLASEPEATPTVEVPYLGTHPDAVSRSFEAASVQLYGPVLLEFKVARFETDGHAHAALTGVIAQERALLDGDLSDVRPISVRRLGNETVAQAGTFVPAHPDAPDSLEVALVAARSGNLVYFGRAAGVRGDQLTPLADVLERVIGRPAGGDATPIAEDGMRTGGLWDLLPRLEDLPEGYSLMDEVPYWRGR